MTSMRDILQEASPDLFAPLSTGQQSQKQQPQTEYSQMRHPYTQYTHTHPPQTPYPQKPFFIYIQNDPDYIESIDYISQICSIKDKRKRSFLNNLLDLFIWYKGGSAHNQMNTSSDNNLIIDNEALVQKINGAASIKNTIPNWIAYKILKETETAIIDINEFNWLKNDKNACMSIWHKLAMTDLMHAVKLLPNNLFVFLHSDYWLSNINPPQTYIPRFGFENDTNHEERLNTITQIFDSAILHTERKIISHYQTIDKKQLMDVLKQYWIGIVNNTPRIAPLSADKIKKEDVNWAWDYLLKHNDKERQKVHDNTFIFGLEYLNPTTDEDRKLAINAAIRVWPVHSAIKKVFIDKLNRAYREKKRREASKGKAVLNYTVDREVRKRLNELARLNQCREHQILTELINEAYRKNKDALDKLMGRDL